MSVSKKQQYVPIGLTVLGELSSNTLGHNIYLTNEDGDFTGYPGMGMAYPGWEDEFPKGNRTPLS